MVQEVFQKQRATKNESLFGTIYTLGTIDTFIIKKSIENNNLRFMQIVLNLLTFSDLFKQGNILNLDVFTIIFAVFPQNRALKHRFI